MSSVPTRSRAQRAVAAVAASAVAAGGSYLVLGAGTGAASSHREAPNTLRDPLTDNTDVYAFVSPDSPDMVTLIANYIPFQVPEQGPNWYPWESQESARYNIKIDNNGDAVPDLTYRWEFQTEDLRPTVDYPDSPDGTFLYNNGPVTSFNDENLLFRQTYTLTEIAADGTETVLVSGAPAAPPRIGEASTPNYQGLRDEAVVETANGGMSFAGYADDPFFLDLRIFDLLYGGDLSERGEDGLNGYNVSSLALKLPIAEVTTDTDPVIGVWATSDRRSVRTTLPNGEQEYSSDFVQVSRLGNPLVNEAVLPIGLKNAFNALLPQNDADVPEAVAKVLDPEVPLVVEQVYGIPAPPAPRDDLFTIFLTGIEGLNQPAGDVRPAELLRLNTSIPPAANPSRLAALAGDFAGFPNGRRLMDDVVYIELQALEGAVNVSGRGGTVTGVEIVEPLAAGDLVNTNDKDFGEAFPYLALPHSGSEPDPEASKEAIARGIMNACPQGVIKEDGFVDVPATSNFELAIDCVFQYGITNGTSATTYTPRGNVTREMMAAFISRLVVQAGGALEAPSQDFFTDDEGSSFEDEINLLAQAGIVQGTGGGAYSPRQLVTRAQMAAFLTRAYNYVAEQAGAPMLSEATENYFMDDEGLGLESAINLAAEAGFTGGFADGTYRPSLPVRRDHMAAFLSRVLDLLVEMGLSEVPAERQ